MEEPFHVSVVIPVYKVELYIHKCIESVVGQTYKKLEIILVDDGSPDNCPEICDEFALQDSRITVIHQQNRGVSSARNSGLQHATGDYIYFIDSDDYIEKDAIETLVREVVDTEVDVLLFDANIFGKSESLSYQTDYYRRKGLYSNPVKGTKMLKDLLDYNEYRSPVQLLFIKRELITRNKLQFYPGIFYEDELFTFQLLYYSSSVVHLPEPLYNRRVREHSIMSSKVKVENVLSIITVLLAFIDMYEAQQHSENDFNVIADNIVRLARSTKKKYYSLSLRDRITTRNDFIGLKCKLKSKSYFNKHEIRNQYSGIDILDCKEIVRKLLTRKLKIHLGNKYLQKKLNCSRDTLDRLKMTRGQRRVILLGTPAHGNLGDHAIALAEVQLLHKHCSETELIEIVMPECLCWKNKIKRLVTKMDILVVSGGGWLGTLWQHNEDFVRSVIKDYPENRIVIMPQTIFFEETVKGHVEKKISQRIYSTHKDLFIFLRDYRSYQLALTENFLANEDKCLYVPDIAVAMDAEIKKQERNGALLCFRTDREKVMEFRDKRTIKYCLRELGLKTKHTTTVYMRGIPLDHRKMEVSQKLIEYASAEIVVTDRLHSMIFAAITGTPCIAFNNVSGKVSGVYEWIKDLHYIKTASGVEEAKSQIAVMLQNGPGSFNNTTIKSRFERVLRESLGENNQ